MDSIIIKKTKKEEHMRDNHFKYAWILIAALLLPVLLMLQEIKAASFAVENCRINREDVFYFPYSEYAKSDVEDLMNRVDKLEVSYSKNKAVNILDSWENALLEVPDDEIFGLYPNAVNFNEHGFTDYSADAILSGYDQFSYVLYNTVFYSYNNLSGETKEQFFQDLADRLYRVVAWQYRNQQYEFQTMRFLTLLDELKDLFSAETQEVIEQANDMASYIEDSFIQEGWWEDRYEVPSQVVKQNRQDAENSVEKVENGNQSQISMEEESENQNQGVQGGYHKNDEANGNADTSYTDTSSTYIDSIQQEYEEAETINPDNAKTEYTIFYTIDKDKKEPEYIDSKVTVKKDEIPYNKVLTVLKSIAAYPDYELFEDTDMLMFIADGKVLVLNKIDGFLSNKKVSHLLDDFETVGLSVQADGR